MKCSYKPDVDCCGEIRCSPKCFYKKVGLIHDACYGLEPLASELFGKMRHRTDEEQDAWNKNYKAMVDKGETEWISKCQKTS